MGTKKSEPFGRMSVPRNTLTAVLSVGLLASAWDFRYELLAASTDR